MTEHFSDPITAGHPDDLPTRRRRKAEVASENQWWNQPPGSDAGISGVRRGDLGGGAGYGGGDGGPVAGGYGAGDDERLYGEAGEYDDGEYGDSAAADGFGSDVAEGMSGHAAGWSEPAAPPSTGPARVAALPPLPDGRPEYYAAPDEPEYYAAPDEPEYYAAPDESAATVAAGVAPGVPEAPAWAAVPEEHQAASRAEARGERGRRASFLDQQPASIPASKGFRGLLTGLGLRMTPSAQELEERRDMRAVSQHWPGPRTISVVNGKGGANKTPTTVMLAAVFARNGGGPVLAWDNNETRGTLGWRTEQGPHEATVMDLLPQTADLLSPSAQSALLARFVHHQIEDKFDVLRSKPDVLASEQKITAEDFDALHEVASKYFRLNIVDSGNDESAERWLRMIDHTDQLVIATTTVEEHAEAGALLLEALQVRGGRYAELARDAVVIVSQSDRNGTDSQARAVAQGFGQLARAAVSIPYDAALRKGQIRYDSLKPAARRAWLAAAAAVAEGL